jgi:phosphonate transport system substrate-binding protein
MLALVPGIDPEDFFTDEMETLIHEASGLNLTIQIPSSFMVSLEALCAGEADIAILNSFTYLAASKRDCVEPGVVSVRALSATYVGQIVTRADSGIQSIEDLRGKTFCRPDEFSVSGWAIPALVLRAGGIDPETDFAEILDAGGHDGVIRAVYNSECDAGSTFSDARNLVMEEYTDVIDQVVILEESDPIPNDSLVFAPDVPQDVRQAVIDALTQSFADESELGTLLTDLYRWQGVEEVDDTFYDPLRQLFEAAGENVEDYVE